jgi:cell division protein FtsI/penicillin-binding protein 2
MVSTVANGGLKVAPRILKDIHIKSPEPVRVISESAAKTLKDMMVADTEGTGTGKRAAIEGVKVAGKTGTAEKLGSNGRYDKTLNVSSFVGFAPADNPEIVALVSIDEPKGIAYGGYVAAPAWKQIVEAALLAENSVL